ncbi:MAG: hypothetical protein ABIK31_01520 [candidate division WOR-3 bacterium]
MKKYILVFLIILSVAFGEWVQLTEVPTVEKAIKDGAALVTYGTFLYALQGGNTNYFYQYNLTGSNWTRKKNIPYDIKPYNNKPIKKQVKAGGALTVLGDYIYAFKGGNTKEFWRYDINADTWVKKAFIDGEKKVKHGGALVTVGDYIYAFKGGNTKEFWMYNPNTDSWTMKAEIPSTKPVKGGGALVNCNGIVYALVGNNTREFFSYNPTENVWTKLADAQFGIDSLLKNIKDGAALAVNLDYIYAFKGGNSQSFGCYNTNNNTWMTLDPIPKGANDKRVKQGGALTVHDGVIYAFKGGNTKEFWKYVIP